MLAAGQPRCSLARRGRLREISISEGAAAHLVALGAGGDDLRFQPGGLHGDGTNGLGRSVT